MAGTAKGKRLMPRQPGRLQHLFEGMEEALQRSKSRGWRAWWAGVSAIPDVMYPADPSVLRAIREFDPNVMAVTVTRVYRASTGEERVERRLAIASHLWNPREEAPAAWTRRILVPTWGPVLHPNHMDMHLEDRSARRGDGLPGTFIPFDWRVHKALRAAWQDWTQTEKVRFIQENDRAAVARRNRLAAEQRIRERHHEDRRFLKRHVEGIDRHDMERILRQVNDPEPAPFVDLGTRDSGGSSK